MTYAPLPSRDRLFWPVFLLFLVPPLIGSALSPLPFAPWILVAGPVFFLLHKLLFKTWPFVRLPMPGLSVIVLALIALMFISYFWAFDPVATYERALKISTLLIAAFALIGVAQNCPDFAWQKYKMIFPCAVLAVGVFTCLDIYFGMPVYAFINHGKNQVLRPDLLNKNASVFVMSLPVALYIAWKSRSVILSLALLCLAVVTMALTNSQACQLSLLVMVVGWFGCLFFIEKLTIRSAFLGLGFLFLMMPWIAPTAFDLLAARIAHTPQTGVLSEASTALRLENYDFLARKIFEKPWTGFGMDSTRSMTFDTQELYFRDNHIMHPHNASLQMWIEFGVFGAAWSVAFLGFFYVVLMKSAAHARRLGFLTFLGIMVFLLVSWSLWSSWLVAFILYLAALCVLATKSNTVLLPAEAPPAP